MTHGFGEHTINTFKHTYTHTHTHTHLHTHTHTNLPLVACPTRATIHTYANSSTTRPNKI